MLPRMLPRFGLAKKIHSELRKVPDIIKAKENADHFLKAPYLPGQLKGHQLLEIGLSYLEDGGNPQMVAAYFRQALEKSSSSVIIAESYYGLAVNAEQLKNYQEAYDHFDLALASCEKFLETKPQEYRRLTSKIFRNKGICFLKNGDYVAAETCFKQSLDIAMQSPDYLRGFIPAIVAYYALALCKNKKYEEGFRQFALAGELYESFPLADLKVSMDYASFFSHQGRVYNELEQYWQAVDVLGKAKEIRIENLKAMNPKTHEYAADRIGAVEQLYQEALNGLKTQQEAKAKTTVKILGNNGSPVYREVAIRVFSTDTKPQEAHQLLRKKS